MRAHVGRATVVLIGIVGAFLALGVLARFLISNEAAAVAPSERNGRQQQYWSNGNVRVDAVYSRDAYDGEYRTYYESGAPYELRHYVNGHEEGRQQSWTESGVLYLNYEVHDGRRYGLVNPSPCNTVGNEESTTTERIAASSSLWSRSGIGPIGSAPNPNPSRLTLDGDPTRRVEHPTDSTGLPYYGEVTFTPRWTPVAHRVAPFTFDTQTGGSVSDAKLRGRPYVASFIYTQCAAVCPIVVRQLARVADAIRPGDARIVSFSVTPETDTPEKLARFGRDRGIDPQKWWLVTGSTPAIYQLARSSFFADDARIGSAPDDERAFLHTEKLLLVDGDGRLRGVYNGTQPHAVDQLIADLHRLATPTRSR